MKKSVGVLWPHNKKKNIDKISTLLQGLKIFTFIKINKISLQKLKGKCLGKKMKAKQD